MKIALEISKKLSEREYNISLFLSILMICFFISVFVRHKQLEIWEKKPDYFYVGQNPMMTTLDAPYWIRWAKEYNEGILTKRDYLRNYPDGKKVYSKKFDENLNIPSEFQDQESSSQRIDIEPSKIKSEIRYDEVPLLSFLISQIAKFFNYNYYLTGTLIIPSFASLFMIPLGIYFFKIGIPLSGLLGGLIGTFASAYFARSSIGRIDTDMLNLFFPILISLMILMAAKSKSERAVLLFSIAGGLILFLFQWWYKKEGFTILFFAVLVFSLFFHKIRIRTILLSAFLFILCTHPETFLKGTDSVESFLKNYLFIDDETSINITQNNISSATFPNVLNTISEADTIEIDKILLRIISDQIIVWIGFISFLILAFLRWKVFLPISPIILLGLLSFQSSNRFIMFLAPLIGIGLGWIITVIIEGCFYMLGNWNIKAHKNKLLIQETKKNHPDDNNSPFYKKNKNSFFVFIPQFFLYMGMISFFWAISSKTAISFVPMPSINTNVYKTFFEIKKIVPKESALLTWWDYGYALTEATRLATFHDGGSQFGPKTYFIARGFLSHDQDELHKITNFISTEGNKGIAKRSTNPKALLQSVLSPKNKPWDPIYIFFTADMTGKFGAISRIGSWDIENGGSNSRGYQNLVCNKINVKEMKCRGATIDLIKGHINNQLLLRRIVFIREGKVLREKNFEHSEGFTIQMIVFGNRIVEVQLIDEIIFNSNYNQMFLLGKYRNDLFDEIYNAFPFSRLFKLKF